MIAADATSRPLVVSASRVQRWAVFFFVWVYMISALLMKLWYIAAASSLLVTVALVMRGSLRIDGLGRHIFLLVVYFLHLLSTFLWAQDPQAVLTGVATDSIEVFVFAMFYIAMLNSSPAQMRSGFAFLAFPALIVTIIIHILVPTGSRSGGYATNVLPYILPFCILEIEQRRTWRSALAFIVALGIILISRSRSPMLVAAIVVPLTVFLTAPRITAAVKSSLRIVVVLLAVIAIILAYGPSRRMAVQSLVRITGQEQYIDGIYVAPEKADAVRAAIISEGLRLFLECQPWGIGYRNFASEFERVYGFRMNMHNSVLQWGIEGGLVSLAIVALLLWRFVAQLRRRARRALSQEEKAFCIAVGIAMVGVLINGMFHRAHQSPPFFLLLAVAAALSRGPYRPRRVVLSRRVPEPLEE